MTININDQFITCYCNYRKILYHKHNEPVEITNLLLT